MTRFTRVCVVLLVAATSACSGPTDAPAPRTTAPAIRASASKSTSVKDPAATWQIPVADAGLSVKSDGRFSDGTYSVYADGVCSVSGRIFATTASSPTPSGDAVLQMSYPKGKSCGRTIIVGYPDGGADTLAAFNNLNKLQSNDPNTVIPIGQTAYRRLIIGFNATLLGNPSSGRCGRIIFGDNGNVGAGTDMLLVTRLNSTTWHVQSQPAPNNRALCENLGEIYDNMIVDFVVVSSYGLPS